jgi:hypothetical protein
MWRGTDADAQAAVTVHDADMDEIIDMDSAASRAGWCGHFSCTDAELANAVRVMASTEVWLVGLYLATRVRTDPRARHSSPS